VAYASKKKAIQTVEDVEEVIEEWEKPGTVTRITVEIEFHVDSTDPKELEQAAQDMMDHLSEADASLTSPYYWEFADWRFEQVEEA